MSTYLIDSHCHLHDQEWFTPAQSEQFLEDAKKAGVDQVIVIGTDPEDSKNAQTFANAHENVFYTYGIHPEYANSHPIDGLFAEEFVSLREAKRAVEPTAMSASPVKTGASTGFSNEKQNTSAGKLVAIGEIGLDYHYEPFDRAAQIRLFEYMLQLAHDLSLPVSLHIREAFDDALPILDNFPDVKGVVHSFTGSKKTLKQVLARDFYVGVNGLITYSTLPLPPLEKMLLETDAPFLTPVPFRGKINTPGYVREIAAYLSEKLGVAEVNIAEQTTKNAQQLFHLQ